MIAWLALLLACQPTATNPQCVDDGNCGDSQICNVDRGVCVDVECRDSLKCGVEEFCDTTDHTCKTGCSTNDDCYAGENCNVDSHDCEAYECRSTTLDCALGEKCNADSGECEDGMGRSCDTCSDWIGGTGCGNNALCVLFQGADQPWCVEECNPGIPDSCARGFDCYDYSGYSDYGCVAWCPTVEANL